MLKIKWLIAIHAQCVIGRQGPNESMKKKVRCPYCGYEMPVFFDDATQCNGLYIRCKGRNCKKVFEIKINVK